MAFKIRRGTNAERLAYTPAIGEPIWTTDTKKLWIGDGITAGGVAVDAESYLNDEYLQDLTAAMFTAGGHSGVSFTYDDNTGRVIATVNFPPNAPASGGSFHFNVTGADSTLKQINSSETIQFTGSNGINVSVNDTAGTTIVNIDGFNVQGGGGSANLEDVGWFVTGTDSTQTRINNDETLQFLGGNGITIAVDDTLAPARLTITSPVNPTVNEVFSIPYYTTTNSSTLVSSGPDLRFSSEHGTLSSNVFASQTVISQLISNPLNISNIQPDTPSPGKATITLTSAHPHPPFYVGRFIKLSGVNPVAWNYSWEVLSCTTTQVVVSTTFTGTVADSGNPTYITGLNKFSGLQTGQSLVKVYWPGSSPGDFGTSPTIIDFNPNAKTFLQMNAGTANTPGSIYFSPQLAGYIGGGTIRETTTRGLNIFPTGDDKFITLGGTLDQNNNLGPIEYPAKLRVLDNSAFFGDGQIAMVEFVQSHNSGLGHSLNFARTRGSFNTPLATINNDTLGAITFTGYDGSSSLLTTGYSMPASAAIISRAAETPTSGQLSLAGKIIFQTAKVGAGYVLSDVMLMDENQNVTMYANATVAEDLAVGSAVTIGSSLKLEGNAITSIASNADLTLLANGTGRVSIEGVLNVTTVDTGDSSAITFTPAALFNSDVTVENNLTVNNKVYANEFVSTSVGSPEIVTSSNFKIRVSNNEFNFNTSGVFKLPVLTAAPGSPTSGMVAVADGTGWDPLGAAGKEQMVVYLGGAWRAIAQEP